MRYQRYLRIEWVKEKPLFRCIIISTLIRKRSKLLLPYFELIIPVPVKSFSVVMIKKMNLGAGSSNVWMSSHEFQKSSSAAFFNSYYECTWELSAGWYQALFAQKFVLYWCIQNILENNCCFVYTVLNQTFKDIGLVNILKV